MAQHLLSAAELKFDIELLEDNIAGHHERGTQDSDECRKSAEMLADRRARLEGFEGKFVTRSIEPERRELNSRPKAGARAANQFGDFGVKRASDAQIRFVKRLLAERDTSKARFQIPTDLDNLSKKVASSAIEILLGCPVKAEQRAEVAAAALATEKQIEAIKREAPRRLWREAITAVVIDKIEKGEPVDRVDASATLDELFNAPFRPREATSPTEALTVGSYQLPDGTVYRVYPAQADRSRMLAKRWAPETGDDGEGSWEYAGMASRFVKPEHLMTLEQAQAFGQEFGVCSDCGAVLTDPTSREFGVGPICRNKTTFRV